MGSFGIVLQCLGVVTLFGNLFIWGVYACEVLLIWEYLLLFMLEECCLSY